MATSGSIIREARLRAGLTQGDLQARTGKDRAQIARWERDAVAPSFDTLRDVVRACGFDIDVTLKPYEPETTDHVAETHPLTPKERVERLQALLAQQPRKR